MPRGNRRLPPEWSQHEATWMTWPHSEPTWPGCLEDAREAFAEMIRVIAAGERVELLIADDDAKEAAQAVLRRSGVELDAVRFHAITTNDSWIRDYGPLFVAQCEASRSDEIVATNWRFNSWGGKYPPWDDDDAAGASVASLVDCGVENYDVVLEGGSIDIDERGCVLTTKQNVFEPNRGPHRGDAFFETIAAPLGATDIIMLGNGIAGDDTDGHVDDITRFTPGRTIVTVREHDRGDVNYAALSENLETLTRAIERTGHRIVELPMPEPTIRCGQTLPASYANFYICNAAVVMPAFGQRTDAVAQEILQGCFQDRPVILVDARVLVVGLGACHCLTLQQPAIS